MGRFARLAAGMLVLALSGCVYVQQLRQQIQPELQADWPALLTCHGDFAQFANGFMVARPMELHFAVWWTVPAVQPTDGGSPARVLSVTPLELSFEVQYEGYKVAYHLNRVDGTFSQRPNLGGIFFGTCYPKPLTTQL
ncbi:MAG TPA: hypothetical protein VME45_10460 [Stellaceae bacterium]|nr:hypothetical protein [Stellaceae bacterium]